MKKRFFLGASGAAAMAALVLAHAARSQPPRFEPPPPADPAIVARLDRLGRRPIRVHDPSTIVRCKDEYWIFCTGRGTPSFRSRDLVNWERGPRTFEISPPWVAEAVPENRGGLDFWAPDAIRVGDRYLLFYSVSSFGKNTSVIAVASNPTLDPADPKYRWTDGGIVVQSRRTDDFNAIDPAVTQDAEGRLWMSFGSFWSGIKMIQLDPKTGKRIRPDSPMVALAHSGTIEAPFIYRRNGYYYLFVNWGFCCRGVNSTYEIRVGRSKKITGPYVDRDGKDLRQGGGSPFLATDGPFIGPGHAGILEERGRFWLGCHFYDPTWRGAGTFAIRPLRWERDGWPAVAEKQEK